MIDYRKELAEIEKLINENRYEECSMLCGKRIELVLKELAKDYLKKVSETSQRAFKENIRQGQPLERMTLRPLAKLYKDHGILKVLIDRNNPNHSELHALDLDMVARIRNKVAHDRQDDMYLEKSDALLLYGSFMKLLAITGLLAADGSDKAHIISVEDGKGQAVSTQSNTINGREVQACEENNLKIRMTPIEADEDEPALHQQPVIKKKAQIVISGKTVTLYKNKKSGKYFVYEDHINAKTMSLITPSGVLKSLDEHLFEEYGEFLQDEAVDKGLATTAQIARHRSLEAENTRLQDSMQQATGYEKTAKVSRHHRLDNAPQQPNQYNRITQDELMPHIVRVLREHGGRARKKEVEQAIYRKFKDTFSQPRYQETLLGGQIRWRHYIDWARQKAKTKGLIKPPEDSGRGFWELTDMGWKYLLELDRKV
ncbi:MAG: hypothetical protein A4E59_00664 [Syntrophorhabdus sp. PtaB.Bin027]|nr:MAG: hypothetical protein A4E59_00664 [Syntrophorhabdus sp. PtaB.Bin027]HPW35936.1 winged helix-turn-helix domain-containing protein [Syntrophorhabdus sp.]HQP57303.1 winged helix-turn-helix domain-containing protein [Syntrophorhabdus sp.]